MLVDAIAERLICGSPTRASMRIVKSSRVSSVSGRTIELVEPFPTPCYALKVIHSMGARAALRSPRTSTLLDDLFSYRSIKRLPRNCLVAWHHRRSVPKNRAQRSIGLLSVSAHWYAKHLMLCTRFACCSDRWFLKAPQSRNRCASSPSPGTGALSRCASVSVKQFIDQTVPVLSVAPSGITPYST